MSIENFRENRKGATVVFVKLNKLSSKFCYSLFCCFEGDDSKYYSPKIEGSLSYSIDNLHYFNCGGKAEVLRLYRMINKDDKYKEVKIAYFVDKDFDKSIITEYNNKIYETPVYSIENFYTTEDCFKKILKCEFNYTESDEEYEKCISLFVDRQEEFHEKTLLFNAWLYCQRDLSNSQNRSRVLLDDFNFRKIIPIINLHEIISDYNLTKIESLFPETIPVKKELIDDKIEYLKTANKQQVFRGKFEIDFLYNFIEAMQVEFRKPNPIIRKQPGVQLNLSKKNLISELSQYASMPNCLKEYINTFKS